MDGFLKISEITEKFNVHRSTVHNYIRLGKVRSKSTMDGKQKILYANLEDFEREFKKQNTVNSELQTTVLDTTPEKMFDKMFAERMNQLIIPMEQQTLFKAGQMAQQIVELKTYVSKYEQELLQVKNEIALLPVPAGEVKQLYIDNIKMTERVDVLKSETDKAKLEIDELRRKNEELRILLEQEKNTPWYKRVFK